jgi:hypothetical protein
MEWGNIYRPISVLSPSFLAVAAGSSSLDLKTAQRLALGMSRLTIPRVIFKMPSFLGRYSQKGFSLKTGTTYR